MCDTLPQDQGCASPESLHFSHCLPWVTSLHTLPPLSHLTLSPIFNSISYCIKSFIWKPIVLAMQWNQSACCRVKQIYTPALTRSNTFTALRQHLPCRCLYLPFYLHARQIIGAFSYWRFISSPISGLYLNNHLSWFEKHYNHTLTVILVWAYEVIVSLVTDPMLL